ncbi:MAG: flagellar biosynthetic protein FliO [Planctomyces sp.]|nr:flagellar biosynthetic protein FliO [Planctomyces sp.]
MSPADRPTVTFGATFEVTVIERLWVRLIAAALCLFTGTSAVLAQIGDPVPPSELMRPARDLGLLEAPSNEAGAIVAPSTSPATDSSKTPIRRTGDARSGLAPEDRATSPLWPVLFAAVVITGGFSLWSRRRPGAAAGQLPADVFQVLGRQSVLAGQSVFLARLGDRLLLIGSSSEGLRTLAEVSDPGDAARLTAECLAGAQRPVPLSFGRSPTRPPAANPRFAVIQEPEPRPADPPPGRSTSPAPFRAPAERHHA